MTRNAHDGSQSRAALVRAVGSGTGEGEARGIDMTSEAGTLAALAHVVRNQTEAAYARSDLFERRRRLMGDWAAYLGGAPEAPGSGPM